MSDATKFHRSQFFMVSGTEETEVAEVNSIAGPDGSPGEINVTHSMSDAVERLPDVPDNGNITLGLNMLLNDPGQDALEANRTSQALAKYKIKFPDVSNSFIEFDAYVMTNNLNGANGTQWTRSVRFAITGAITEGAG